jgi:O-antigen/teichoic acid export membrane protein
MSRLKNFSRNLATSYLQLGVNVVYSLVSIPLILHWLPRAEFGLWAVLVQLMAYISLVDLGVNQAIARFLVDHKDHRSEGEYGALVRTSALVSAVQGLIVLAVVMMGSPLLAGLMKIPAEYSATFITLMRLQGVIAAFIFCTNPLSIMLNAHQRMDLLARQSIYNLMLSLGLLWLFLRQGCGIYSFIYVGAIIALIAPCQLFWYCRRLGFLPRAGEWGKISWPQFKEVLLYGKDVFLMNVGAQIITTSQIIIISRALGLEAAAAWTVGTKVFMLVRQVLFQPYSAAVAGLSEMVVRNEHDRLQLRFKNLVVLTASLGVFLGVTFALCNSLFVMVWTGGKIVWSPWNDVLLAIWFFGSSLQCTHCNFVGITKQIGVMSYLYFVEGCCFVALALLLGYRWGLPGIIGCSLVCTLLFSCQFGLWRSSQYFHLKFRNLAFEWVRPSWKFAAVLVPVALILWIATTGMPSLWRLAIHGVAMGLVGGILFLRLGLPPEVVRETGARLPPLAARLLVMLAPCSARI